MCPWLLAAVPLLACLAGPGPAPSEAPGTFRVAFRVVVDPGHDPERPGASSARGVPEVDFNDPAAAALMQALGRLPGVEASLSRAPGERLGPRARLKRLRAARPDLVLSIHHDSAQPRYFDTWSHAGVRRPHSDRFAGFCLLVPGRGPAREPSLRAARAIADALLARGERITRHHAEPIPGEGRAWLDEARGIHDGDYVGLVRELGLPIVLLERGVIVNRTEELRLADPTELAAWAEAVARVVDGAR
jgi:N-acetylmuramoyl-L-alanine amidase